MSFNLAPPRERSVLLQPARMPTKPGEGDLSESLTPPTCVLPLSGGRKILLTDMQEVHFIVVVLRPGKAAAMYD
jgi:hypothetical protein